MKFKRISIRNWMGLQDLDFRPGSFCVISGQNGHGKSSAIEAIRAVGEHVHDPARIRNGAEYAEVVIELDNGYVLKMRTRPKSTTWTFTDNLGHEIKRSAEFIQSIINAMSLDPVKFIDMKESEQIKAVLSAMPLRATAEDLKSVPVRLMEGVDLDKHALEVIGDKNRGIYKGLYDERTFANRKAKDAHVYAEQLRKSLPEDAPEGNWGDLLKQKNSELHDLRSAAQVRAGQIRKDAADAETAEKDLCDEQEKALDAELETAIEKLRADTEIAKKAARGKRDAGVKRIWASGDSALEIAKAEYNPKNEALVSEISRATAMVEQHAKAEATRNLIDNQEQAARDAESESARLTRSLEDLEALKTRLVSESPIPGLEITADGLMLNGVPFRIVNLAERLRVAIELAKLQPGECGIVLVDNAEHLDSKNFAAFEEAARKSGLQFISAKVADSDLTVTTEGSAA